MPEQCQWVGCPDPDAPVTVDAPMLHISVVPARPTDREIVAHWQCFPHLFRAVGADEEQ